MAEDLSKYTMSTSSRSLRCRKPINYAKMMTITKDEDISDISNFSEGNFDDDDNESSILVNDTDNSNEYIIQRQKNIEERQKILQELNIDEFKNDAPKQLKRSYSDHNRTKSIQRKPQKRLSVVSNTERRKSLRLQAIKPEVTDHGTETTPKQWGNYSTEEMYGEKLRKEETTMMFPEDDGSNVKDFFISLDGNLEDTPISNTDLAACTIDKYYGVLKSCEMWSPPERILPTRIVSLDIHPSQSKFLVIGGDRDGRIGLWNLQDNKGIQVEPHSASVNCVTFGISDKNKFFSTSHDGTVRYGDLNTESVKLLYSTAANTYNNHTTWHYELDNSLYIAHGTGEVRVIDIRDPKSNGLLLKCHKRSVRTVQCHPMNSNYFITSSSVGEVGIWDIRQHSSRKSASINLLPHPKALTSAFFSSNGNYIVTTCNDDTVKVFRSDPVQEWKKIQEIRHRNHTGRFLSVFKAKWLPGREDMFHIGSMLYPKRIQIYQTTEGKIVHNLMNEEYMTTYCPVISVHPTLPLYVGGNSTGKIHVFAPNEDLSFAPYITSEC